MQTRTRLVYLSLETLEGLTQKGFSQHLMRLMSDASPGEFLMAGLVVEPSSDLQTSGLPWHWSLMRIVEKSKG